MPAYGNKQALHFNEAPVLRGSEAAALLITGYYSMMAGGTLRFNEAPVMRGPETIVSPAVRIINRGESFTPRESEE